jgi:hypothetical protein
MAAGSVNVRRRVALAVILALMGAASAAGVAAAAPPAITYSLAGTAGDNGWFRSAVTVSWSVDFRGLPPVTSTGCEPAVRLASDTPAATLTCTAENADGVTTARTKPIKIDQTPPVVTATTPDRAPDTNGWYRSPVGITWAGTDATSGIAACTSLTYAGPDGPASPVGSCRDLAGNSAADVPFPLRYDATPPGLSGVTAVGGDTVATVQWQAAADAATVTVVRSPGPGGAAPATVFQGLGSRLEDTGLANGLTYTYTVTAADAAGNASTATATAQPASRLRAPKESQRFRSPPLLRWRAVRGSQYYNVQLFRDGTKVLSAWPIRARLRLHRTWRFEGRRHRLSPGTYRWYVWPGYGPRPQHRYGRLLGTRQFVVTRAAAT